MAEENKIEENQISIDLKKDQVPVIPVLDKKDLDPRVSDLELAKSFRLRDGRIVRVYEGLSGHTENANFQCQTTYADENGEPNQSFFFPVLMSDLVTIDNKFLSPEDWKKVKMKDYNMIYASFTAVNF